MISGKVRWGEYMRKTATLSIIATFIIATLLGQFVFIADEAGSATVIFGGKITTDTTWYLSDSPFYIEGDVYVENRANLTIQAGCEIFFNGSYGLFIANGTLTAVGTPSDNIKFTSNDSLAFYWDSIQINATGKARISYCNLTYGDTTIYMDHSNGNVIENSNISNGNYIGIWLSWSNSNKIQNNSICYNGWHGIHLYYGNSNTIKNNTIHHNFRGVYLGVSEKNNITKNNIYSNWYDGIYLISLSHGNNITKNNISTNDVSGMGKYGIYLSSCFNNRIYHNIFWNNTRQAYENGSNFWNMAYPICGNYWSDFDEPNEGAYDNLSGPMQDIIGGDGIADDPYIHINSTTGGIDKYPLMNPSVARYFAYLNSPINNSVVKPGTLLDFIIVGDDIDFVNYTVNGGPNNTFDPSWDINESETGIWVDGPYIIEIQIFDRQGNVTEFWFNITIDSVLPEIILNSPTNGSLISRGVIIDLTVTDLHLAYVRYSRNGGPSINIFDPYDINTSTWVDQNHIIQIYAYDKAGNMNTTWYNFTVDGTSPSITLITPKNNSCILPGTWLRFNITDPNLDINNIYHFRNGAGPFTFTEYYNISTTSWPDGIYIIQVNAADYLGNLRTRFFNFTIDSTPPKIYLVFPTNNSVITKATVLDFDIYDVNLYIVNYTVNFTQKYTLLPPFDINATATWEDGPYTIGIFALDKAGNSNSSSYNFLMATPPKITLLSPENNSLIKVGTIINLDVSDTNLKHVNYSKNGGANISFNIPYDISTGSWPDGDYIIEVHAVDHAGNFNSKWYRFTIDAKKPSIIFVSHTNNSYFNPGPILDFEVSDINLIYVNYSINGSAFAPFSSPYDISTASWHDDPYTIVIEAIDAVGYRNISVFVITIDSKPPVIELVSPPNGTSSEIGIFIDLSIFDENLDYVTYSINNGVNHSLFSPFNINTTPFPDGLVTLTVHAVDFAGNFNKTYYEFIFNDITKPYITLISPNNQSYIPTGTIIDFYIYDLYLNKVSYSLDGGDLIPFLDPYDIDTSAWTEGQHIIVVWANDTRNNTNTSTIIITIDSEIPWIFINTPSNDSVILPGTILDFHIDEDNIKVANYTINNGTSFILSWPWDLDTTGWEDGIYTIKIQVGDHAGNWNSAWFIVTIDSTPPLISLNSPGNGSHIKSGTTIDINIIDANLEEVMYSINGGPDSQLFLPFDIDTSGWEEGSYIIKVHAMDIKGNTREVTFFFTVDNTSPEAQVYVSAPFYPYKFTRIHIYFSEVMDQTSVMSALSIKPDLNYSLEWSDDHKTLTLVNIIGLQLNVQYFVNLGVNATDLAGNSLYNFTGYHFVATIDIELDTDGDEMPDGWEFYYGLDPYDPSDNNTDLDGDGYTNLEEFKGGSDPTDPNSTPQKDMKESSTLQFWWLIPILIGLLVIAIILFMLLLQERKEEPKGPVEQVEDIYLAMRAQKDISNMEKLLEKEDLLGEKIDEAKIMVRKAKEAFEKREYTAITVYFQTLKDLIGVDIEEMDEIKELKKEKTTQGKQEKNDLKEKKQDEEESH